jgi:hypothetical protein
LQITFVPYTLSVRPAGAHFLPTNAFLLDEDDDAATVVSVTLSDDAATVVSVTLSDEPELPELLVPPVVPAAQTENGIIGPIP